MIRALFTLLALLVAVQADAAITRRFTGTAADAINGGNISPTLGGTTNSGDLVTCAVTQRNATDYTKIAASGYTALAGKNHGSSGTSVILAKIAGAGESDPTITSSDTTSGRTLIGQCTVWAGTLDTVTGIVAHSNTAENAAGFSITTPSLTVTTDNTVVLYVASKANDWNAENPVIGASDALTELGQPERTSSAQVGMVWAYRIQTTAATVTPGDVTLTENSANGWSLAVSIKPAAAAPTFSSGPTVSAQDENDYTLSYTPSTSATFYAVACLKDSTAPTVSQVKAGNCTGDAAAIASVNEAVTGADTTVLGGSLTRPIHDLYAVLSNAGGDTSLQTLADEMLDAPTGYQYDLLASVSVTSPCADLNADITPDIAAADVSKFPTTTSPSGYAFTAGTDCDTSYSDPVGSRQSVTLDVYDTSAGDWMSGGPATVYFNNSAPECLVANCEFDTGELFIDGEEMAEIDTATWFDDADGDTPTITSSDTGTGTGADKRPANTSYTDGVWAGTLACNGGDTTGSHTITATDVAGDTAAVTVTWACYDQVAVPDCEGDSLATCLAEAEAVSLSVVSSFVCDPTGEAFGTVLSQDPAAAASVNPFSGMTIETSSGPCVGNKVKMRAGRRLERIWPAP